MFGVTVAFVLACSGNLQFQEIPAQQIEAIHALPFTTDEVTRIYFIHNAESEYSVKDERGTKFTSGKSPHVHLNERGKEQAGRLGSLLSSRIENAIVFVPPAKRAEETAAFLLSDKVIMGPAYEGLFEVSMGVWEGKPKDELYKAEHHKWKKLSAIDKYITPRISTGESYLEASNRAMDDLERILQSNSGKTILIISGENLLNALAIRWMNPNLSEEPGEDLPMLPMAKGDFFLVEIPRGQSMEQAHLKMLFHL